MDGGSIGFRPKHRWSMTCFHDQDVLQFEGSSLQSLACISVFLTMSLVLKDTTRRKDIKCAFLPGKRVTRELYATQPKAGVPGPDPRELLCLEKEAFGTVMGTAQPRGSTIGDIEQMGHQKSSFDSCCRLLKSVARHPEPQDRHQLQNGWS